MARMGWIPQAALGAAVVAIVGGTVGCGNKDEVPTAPPLAAAEPAQIFKHLQYLAVRKDYKHVALIAPVDPAIVFSSGGYFHSLAGQLKLELTDEELAGLGIADMKDKLGKPLPTTESPDYSIEKARLVFNAGLYRVLKGVPTEAWSSIVVSEVKKNPSNTLIQDVLFAYNGKQFLSVSCIKKADGTYGVSYVRYLQSPAATFGAKSKPKA